MSNGPFYALLAYVIVRDVKDFRLTRLGFRSLIEKRPPEPRPKDPSPPAAEQQSEWPGDGYRPQPVPDRRTG
jgi:hypothetical protein